MEKGLISIIIPVYKAEKYIARCLDALIVQTYNNWQALVIDNNSPDNCAEIIKKYAAKDSRIKYLFQPIAGPAAARNMGLDNAIGEFLMFCDSDDWYEPNMCEEMYRAIMEQNVDCVMCNTFLEDETKRGYAWPLEQGQYLTRQYLTRQYLTKINVWLWNKIFRKAIVDDFNIRMPEHYKSDDNYFIYVYMIVAKSIYVLNVKLYHYSDNPDGVMGTYIKCPNFHDLYSHIAILQHFADFIKKHKLEIDAKIFTSLVLAEILYAWRQVGDTNVDEYLDGVRKLFKSVDGLLDETNIDVLTIKKFIEPTDSVHLISFMDWAVKMRIRLTRNNLLNSEKIKPAFQKNNIAIAFNVDDNYIKYVAVAIESIIQNSSIGNNYDILILCDFISQRNQALLKSIFFGHSNFSIRFIYLPQYISKYVFRLNQSHIKSKTCYYRIFMANILTEYKKILYLDSDIVVQIDISRLFNIDLSGFTIGAIRDVFLSYNLALQNSKMFCDFPNYARDVLEMPVLDNYFNSGVMLMNLDKIRENNLLEKFITVMDKNNKFFNDQNVLNSVLQKDVKIIDGIWNEQVNQGLFNQGLFNQGLFNESSVKSAAILHYCSQIKPWNNQDITGASVWWKYARETPFYENLLMQNINTYTEAKINRLKNMDKSCERRHYKRKIIQYKLLNFITLGFVRKFREKKSKYRQLLRKL